MKSLPGYKIADHFQQNLRSPHSNIAKFDAPSRANDLSERFAKRVARVGIIGIGYVGLPLAIATARAGYVTTGFDIDPKKPDQINAGRSYISNVPSEELARHLNTGHLHATTDFKLLSQCDVVIICVPTPLAQNREPDLSFICRTGENIAENLQRGQLIVLESTSFPGTTVDVLKPILERSGLVSGQDFWLAFSPEREDPGNKIFNTANIPKIVAGDCPQSSALVELFYSSVVEKVVRVSSPAVAEAVKITENVFRAVNIALVNELKVAYEAMGIDIWEVIEAAATKPFGFMPFYPGPGLGGHCIPIDPFYLAWKVREYGLNTPMIRLAGEINTDMPNHVMSRVELFLDRHHSISLDCARILLLGIAYKKNVSDTRESPAFTLFKLFENRGAQVDFHDPHVPEILPNREHTRLEGRKSVSLNSKTISSYDAILLVTDHDAIDYDLIAQHGRLIIDTRNAFGRRGLGAGKVLKA